jgi:hypothetical protein
MSFLCLLRLELLLHRSLIALTMLGLTGGKRSDGIFELISDLLRKL